MSKFQIITLFLSIMRMVFDITFLVNVLKMMILVRISRRFDSNQNLLTHTVEHTAKLRQNATLAKLNRIDATTVWLRPILGATCPRVSKRFIQIYDNLIICIHSVNTLWPSCCLISERAVYSYICTLDAHHILQWRHRPLWTPNLILLHTPANGQQGVV